MLDTPSNMLPKKVADTRDVFSGLLPNDITDVVTDEFDIVGSCAVEFDCNVPMSGDAPFMSIIGAADAVFAILTLEFDTNIEL